MRIMPIALTILLTVSLCACNPDAEVPSPRPPAENPGEIPGGGDGPEKPTDPTNPPQATRTMRITTGSAAFTATLADNAAAAAFRAMLPMTVGMGELNGNEKYYYLPNNLPAAAANPGTIRNGDIMLFGSGTLVLFYKTFSTSYSYTHLGSVDNPSELEAALGRSEVTVKFESTNE